MSSISRVALSGSTRFLPATARLVSTPDAAETIKVTVYVRQNPAGLQIPANSDLASPAYRRVQEMMPADREKAFGADPEDLAKVEAFATAAGLTVLERNHARRSVLLAGSVGAMSEAFGVNLKIYDSQDGPFRGRTGDIMVPAELKDIIDGVFGLDNRRMGRSYRRSRQSIVTSHATHPPNTYLPPQVAQLYNFPQGFDGTTQTIGILTFNGALASTGITATGGYNLDAVRKYFTTVLNLPTPSITDVVVHGPGNTPGDGTSDTDVSGEVMLDIQVAGGCAPGAKFVMYFTEFTEQGWVDAITTASTDHVNNPSVLSISYGNSEDGGQATLWSSAAVKVVNDAFRRAALAGTTICCAAGDDGSSDGITDHKAHVDFPASSPFVLGCGGTRLESTQGHVTRETVWNDGPGSATGGGISTLFPVPDYQRSAGIPASANAPHRLGRGVPDVSGLADPDTGLIVMNNSGTLESSPVGGTSATAPLWAALVARLNQALGTRLGFINPVLYQMLSQGVLRDIRTGDNGMYRSGAGWDACTGLGSPDGAKLLAALRAVPPTVGHATTAPSAPDPVTQMLSQLATQIGALTVQSAATQAELARLETILASALTARRV